MMAVAISNPQALKVVTSAMGVGIWWFFIAGVFTGQLASLGPLVAYYSTRRTEDELGVAVSRAVAETLKVCVETELSSTTTSTSGIVTIGAPLVLSGSLWIYIGVLLACSWLCVGCGWWLSRLCHQSRDPEAESDQSPLRQRLPIATLAQQQLAELRIRRNAV